jgi:hypothetical protein
MGRLVEPHRDGGAVSTREGLPPWTLLQSDRAGEAALARFEREVRRTAALTHPNAMELVDGRSLRAP